MARTARANDRLTCADFRARRERMGISRKQMQCALGVGSTSISRWESTTKGVHMSIPPQAWEWLRSQEHEFDEWVERLVDSHLSSGVEGYAAIPYSSTDERKRAMARAVGERLMARGIEVTYIYED